MVITIGRQYGSGGRAVGRKLADLLGIPFYDRELLTIVAKENGFSEEVVEEYDEKPGSSFLYALYMDSFAANVTPINQTLALAQFDAIKRLAASPCVIVGRCGDYILRDKPDCLKVFVYSDMENRRKRIAEASKVSPEQAEKTAVSIDKKRARYYEFYTGVKWGQMTKFDLCVNSDILGEEGTARLIYQFVRDCEALR